MSDWISTPSQTQSSVSNEAFEALIDLLASDGIDENSSRPSDARPQADVTLRDASGKLDFDRIRTMFGITTGERVDRVQSPSSSVPHEGGDSDDESHSHRSASSTVPSRPHSTSPKPVERPSPGHRRSSTFGNVPWVAIHENPAEVEDAPTLSRQPLSFDELNTALAGAHEEVRSLRQRYDELKALVAKHLETEIRDQAKLNLDVVNTKEFTPNKDHGRVETSHAGPQAQASAIVPLAPPPSNVPAEIANLSENEAKRALSALARSLNLSSSAMVDLSTPIVSTSPQQSLIPPSPTRQHDVASIVRALKFLGTVDELVWRRTSGPSGLRTLLPVFSEENVVALVARLELWERAVRRSSRT